MLFLFCFVLLMLYFFCERGGGTQSGCGFGLWNDGLGVKRLKRSSQPERSSLVGGGRGVPLTRQKAVHYGTTGSPLRTDPCRYVSYIDS